MDEIYDLTLLQSFAYSKELANVDKSYYKRDLQIALLGSRGEPEEVVKIINGE